MTNRLATLGTVALGVLLATCDDDPTPDAEGPEDGPAPEAEAPSGAELASHMGEHFWGLADAHDAAIAGDVDGLREAADWLASHEEEAGFPAEAAPYLDVFRERAREAATAPDLDAAGVALSAVAASCGACHQALGSPLPTVVDDQPDAGSDLITRMGAHIRAADLMWEALVAPSGEAWDAGVSLLASVDLLPGDVTDDPADARVVGDLLATVRRIAREGTVAAPGQRARLYGELVATCGRCHEALGRGFDPSR